MDWIKIPTDSILYSEFKDSELIALIKYQALYCQLESQPTTEQMKRILNRKQLQFVQSYSEVVQELCKNQVQIIKQKRNRDKENYKQKQTLTKNSAVGKLSERELVSVADKIRIDNIPPIIPLKGDEIDYNSFIERWNRNASRYDNFIAVRTLTDARKKNLKRRFDDLKKNNIEPTLDSFFKEIGKAYMSSSFLRGEKNGFNFTLDFVLQASSFQKILEGGYKDCQ